MNTIDNHRIILEKILKEFEHDLFFQDFKLRKKDTCLIKKFNGGQEFIELQSWQGYDLKRNSEAIVVYPLYLKRFDILHNWFEKYSFKNIKDQRNKYSIGFDGKMLGKQKEFNFSLDGLDYAKDIDLFMEEIMENSKNVFNKYSDIESLYNYLVKPVLNESKEFPNVGADWIFEYITITRIVNKKMMNTLIEKIKPHVKKMYEMGEPNVIEYYSDLDEIISNVPTSASL